MDLSIDDANVIMHVLGSLEKILDVTEDELNEIPVDTSMKHKLLNFFNSDVREDHCCGNRIVSKQEGLQQGTSEQCKYLDELSQFKLHVPYDSGRRNFSEVNSNVCPPQDTPHIYETQQFHTQMDFQGQSSFVDQNYNNEKGMQIIGTNHIHQNIKTPCLHSGERNQNTTNITNGVYNHQSDNCNILATPFQQSRPPFQQSRIPLRRSQAIYSSYPEKQQFAMHGHNNHPNGHMNSHLGSYFHPTNL